MKRNLLKSFLAVGILTSVYQFSAPAFAGEGTGSDGGNFAFEDFANSNIKNAGDDLARYLMRIPKSEFKKWSEEFNAKPAIDKDELIEIIKNVKIDEGGVSFVTDKNGNKRYRDLFFNEKDRRILALQLFLVQYNHSSKLTSEQKAVLQTRLLHEATHLYGIGRSIETNVESRKLAVKMMDYINQVVRQTPHISEDVYPFKTTTYNCGLLGDLNERIFDCNLQLDNNWKTISKNISEEVTIINRNNPIFEKTVTQLPNELRRMEWATIKRTVFQMNLNKADKKIVLTQHRSYDWYTSLSEAPQVSLQFDNYKFEKASNICNTVPQIYVLPEMSNIRLPSVKELQDLFLLSKYQTPVAGCFWSNEENKAVCSDGSVKKPKKTGFLNHKDPEANVLCIGDLK